MLVDPLVRTAPAPFVFLIALFLVGAASYVYTVFICGFLRKPKAFVAGAVRKLNGTTVEVTLIPQGQPLAFTAGQFVFVHFEGDTVLAEPHPFTVCSAPHEDHFRLAIKASGDWTQYLVDHIKPGMKARVDGSFGMFNYKTGRKQQVWIAGGIGLTPFLSWIRDFKRQIPSHEIDFYYTVRAADEALFVDEIERASTQHRNFRAYISYSNKEGHLSADRIVTSSGPVADKEIYVCGPIAMTNALQKGFAKLGLPGGLLHFEEFNFR